MKFTHFVYALTPEKRMLLSWTCLLFLVISTSFAIYLYTSPFVQMRGGQAIALQIPSNVTASLALDKARAQNRQLGNELTVLRRSMSRLYESNLDLKERIHKAEAFIRATRTAGHDRDIDHELTTASIPSREKNYPPGQQNKKKPGLIKPVTQSLFSVSLGRYSSIANAERAFLEYVNQHPKMLASLQPRLSVAYEHDRAQIMLTAGAIANYSKALQICIRLQAANTSSCEIVARPETPGQ